MKYQRRKKSAINIMLPWIMLVSIIAIIVGGIYSCWHSDYIQKKFIYPWPYEREVRQYSGQYRVDPYLAIAVIKHESGFDPEATSQPGALGLMQIMPETGAWIARTTDFPNFRDELLKLPELNIKFGCWYLSELSVEFKKNEVLMLAAYNAGRGNVKQWMVKNNWGYDFQDIQAIPYLDTRAYVDKVLESRNKYFEYYQKKLDE